MRVRSILNRKVAGSMFVCFLAVAGMITGSQGSMTAYAADELQGSGTEEDPYVITDSEDLWQFAEIVKASSERKECAKVADGVTNIDTTIRGESTDLKWTPIGDWMTSYQGIFDGNGAEIRINVDTGYNDNAGFIGVLGGSGEIRNMTTTGKSAGGQHVGGICGKSDSKSAKIVNCSNKADVTAKMSDVGGLVGYACYMTIESDASICNTGAITGTKNVGGIVGSGYYSMSINVQGDIINSGNITATQEAGIGGIIGYADRASICAEADIINRGKISFTGTGSYYAGVGGLVGNGTDLSVISSKGKLQNEGEVTAAVSQVGGIAGKLVSYSYSGDVKVQAAKGIINKGTVTGKSSVGGLVGENALVASMISADGCLLNTGAVKGDGENVGGVIGRMASSADGGSYANTGTVTNTGKYTGGVIGLWAHTASNLENAWNTGTVEITGENAAEAGGIVGAFWGVNIKNVYHTTAYPLVGNGEDDKDKISGEISNCYCTEENTSPWSGEITKSKEAFANGEVAYLLDGTGENRNAELSWGQKIGSDLFPVLGGMTVYQDGSIYSNTEGHNYNEPEYTWNENDKGEWICTAERTCQGCGDSERESVTAGITEQKAGCETDGKKEYTAEFKNPSFEKQTKTVIIPQTGHNITDVSWSKDEKTHWKDCKNACGKKFEEAEHTFLTIIDRAATESTEGSSHEECSVWLSESSSSDSGGQKRGNTSRTAIGYW